ncbi:FtsW/RodA/SpoVE family cell cycle protein [Paenibacillus puerhi]|uniref:FtsW/RodA/SpoVE family cell cycle protein n=1 Tax=Paenibacillus puerhi TaxID=2692622 RepID=UPI0013576BA4|nr:FtsW/RodA/SpoVE family cell cycle protein [Paenibacillus puerhi]
MIRYNEAVRQFLNEVCSEIRSREAHPHIRQELESHLECLAEERESLGADREEALKWAVAQMGDPRLIGKDLHRIHRPKLEWGLLATIIAFIGYGIMAIYALDKGVPVSSSTWGSEMLFLSKLAAAGLGLVIMVALYYFPYRKLQDLTWLLYAVLLIGLCLVLFLGSPINGSPRYLSIGFFYIDWPGISSFLFILVAAGCLPAWFAERNHFFLRNVALLAPVVGLLALCKTTPAMVLVLVGYFTVLGSVTKRWKTSFALSLGSLITFCWLRLASNPFEKDRLLAFLNPDMDSYGSGYSYYRIAETIKAGGWLGQGLGSPLPQFPSMHSELIFTFSLYSFGWLAGIGLAVVVLYMISRFWHSFAQVRDPFGKHLVLGLASILVFQLVYNLLMSVGLLPHLGIPLPFVSYGFYHMLYEMSAIGIILSIYRRKDLSAGSAGPASAS